MSEPRPKRSIQRELNKVAKQLQSASDGPDRDALYGAQQALSWVLRENAAAASESFLAARAAGVGNKE